MKRKIIKINLDKCDGCGACIPNCPEGALQIIDGKARIVSEFSCDGLGACIGHCPKGAIKIEEREAKPYDESAVMENIVRAGTEAIKTHLRHLKEHDETEYLREAVEFLKIRGIGIPDYEPGAYQPKGCPGLKIVDMRDKKSEQTGKADVKAGSELRQWPVQIALLNPDAPYFKNADLLFSADCVPFAYPDFHEKLLKNRILVIFCPKLDSSIGMYIEKISAIFKNNNIKSVTIARMEVPCCSGVGRVVLESLKRSGKNIPVKEFIISIKGEIM